MITDSSLVLWEWGGGVSSNEMSSTLTTVASGVDLFPASPPSTFVGTFVESESQ